jgi:hypothetical protein
LSATLQAPVSLTYRSITSPRAKARTASVFFLSLFIVADMIEPSHEKLPQAMI